MKLNRKCNRIKVHAKVSYQKCLNCRQFTHERDHGHLVNPLWKYDSKYHIYRADLGRKFGLGVGPYRRLVNKVDCRKSTFSAMSRSLSYSWDDFCYTGLDGFYKSHYFIPRAYAPGCQRSYCSRRDLSLFDRNLERFAGGAVPAGFSVR